MGIRIANADEQNDLMKQAKEEGTPVKKPYAYPGEVVELSDGTWVGKREQAGTGGPTLDVRTPSGEFIKVKSYES